MKATSHAIIFIRSEVYVFRSFSDGQTDGQTFFEKNFFLPDQEYIYMPIPFSNISHISPPYNLMFKKYRVCFFKNYLFIHEYRFYPLQSNAHQILYTCAKVFSNPRCTSKNHFLWSCLAPPTISVLARAAASFGMIELWFPRHNHKPMIRHQLWSSRANMGRRGQSPISPEQC